MKKPAKVQYVSGSAVLEMILGMIEDVDDAALVRAGTAVLGRVEHAPNAASDDVFLVQIGGTPAKPSIEDVFSAFQTYQNDSVRALTDDAAMFAATERLQDTLDALGLADHIDWEA